MPRNFFKTFRDCLTNESEIGLCTAKLIKKHYKLILTVTIIFGIIIAATVIYKQYIKPKLNKTYVDNEPFTEGFDPDPHRESDPATLYFFYTDWCPHCKNAKPIMEEFKTKTSGGINGKRLLHKPVDCDKEPELADKFGVSGYPSIKLHYKSKIYDYDAKPDVNTLTEFLNQTITG